MPDYRNTGVGRHLKLEQRLWALNRDVELIEWTFDPLQIKNAFFNIERLGVIVRRYVHNQYGTSSRLHGGLPTDRFVPEWWIRSPRVEAMITDIRSTVRLEARIAIPSTSARLSKEIQPKPSRFNRFADSSTTLSCRSRRHRL